MVYYLEKLKTRRQKKVVAFQKKDITIKPIRKTPQGFVMANEPSIFAQILELKIFN